MKKWIGLLKSVIFSFLVYMWFLGSSLLLRIDSHQIKEERAATLLRERSAIQTKWENRILNLTDNMNSYCTLKKKSDQMNSVMTPVSIQVSNLLTKKNEEEEVARKIVMKAKSEKIIRDNIIYIPHLQQLWCLVPKAASTSWSHKILDYIPNLKPQLQSDLKNTSVPVQVVLRKYFGNIGTKKFNDLIASKSVQKVVLARHPLSRLVSAFEDKLKDRKARPDSMYFYGHYGVKINRAFRKNRRINKRKEPTFEEFIDYLIKTNPQDYDEHWKPISLLCGLCHLNYNHVIKQEDLENDLEFHLAKLGYNTIQTSSKEFRNDNKSLKDFKSIQDYFRNITTDKKRQLFQKYEDDFKLFQYDTNNMI